MKPIRTWILIADQGTAKILQNNGPGKGLTVVPGVEMTAPKINRPQNPKGRTFSSVGARRHTHEPRHQEDAVFVKEIVEMLEVARMDDRFDRLILCAPPEMLGILRANIGAALVVMIHGEMAKDLIKIPMQELPSHLDDLVVV